jgi:2-iminobutanoate/2-iminopropanoate deaminase
MRQAALEEDDTMALPTRHILAGFPPSISPSSHAVECDGWVFLTGQLARDLDEPAAPLLDDIGVQTRRTLDNLRKVLSSLDLGLENVVSVRVFLTRFRDDYAAMNAVYGEIFPLGQRPARTCVGVTDLVPGARVEIDCIARRP